MMNWNLRFFVHFRDVFLPTAAHFVELLLPFAIHPMDALGSKNENYNDVRERFTCFAKYFMDILLQVTLTVVFTFLQILTSFLSTGWILRPGISIKGWSGRPVLLSTGNEFSSFLANRSPTRITSDPERFQVLHFATLQHLSLRIRLSESSTEQTSDHEHAETIRLLWCVHVSELHRNDARRRWRLRE